MSVDSFPARLNGVNDSHTVVALRGAILRCLSLFGISRLFFVAPLSEELRIGRVVSSYGLSWVWERHYAAYLHQLDPLPRLAMTRLAPVLWPNQIDLGELETKERRYLKIAARHGLERGVGVACFGPNGRSSFMGAVLDEDAALPNQRDLMRIQVIGHLFFQRYCHLVPIRQKMPALSNRELEVLQWIGRGKSNSVIASLLEISPSSVDVYTRRIFAKLGVADRTSASVKAISLGLMVSNTHEQLFEANSERQRQEKQAAQPGSKDPVR